MRRLGWTIRLQAGQPLLHEGDPATRVFTLTRGALKLYKLLPDGRRQVTGFMFPGDFLGIAVDDEHAFTVEAVADSQLLTQAMLQLAVNACQHTADGTRVQLGSRVDGGTICLWGHDRGPRVPPPVERPAAPDATAPQPG